MIAIHLFLLHITLRITLTNVKIFSLTELQLGLLYLGQLSIVVVIRLNIVKEVVFLASISTVRRLNKSIKSDNKYS